MPRRTPFFHFFFALALVTSASSALAEPTEAEIEAKAAMKRGIAAFAKRDAETALAEYKTASRLVPDANLPHRYTAEALVELERYEEAIQEYETYLRIKPDVSDAGEVKQRMEKARAKIDGMLEIRSSPAGATVYIDGSTTAAGTTPLTGLKVHRGPHSLVLKLPDLKDVTLSPTVRGGDTIALAATFPDASSGAREGPRPVEAKPSHTLGWVALGTGGALLGTALVIDGIILPSKFDNFDAKRRIDDPTAGDALSHARTLQVVTVVGYVAGGVLAATGVALLLWPRKPGTTTAPVKGSIGLGGASLSVGF